MNRTFMPLSSAMVAVFFAVCVAGCGGEAMTPTAGRTDSGASAGDASQFEDGAAPSEESIPKSASRRKYNSQPTANAAGHESASESPPTGANDMATPGVAALGQKSDMEVEFREAEKSEVDESLASVIPEAQSGDSFNEIVENKFVASQREPFSTFSIDVDTAAYSIVRRSLRSNQLPPKDAVRIEELVNYFPYEYDTPTGDVPFAVNAEVATCPWAPEHYLVRFGLKGREVENRPLSNLVFLLDVSGSMQNPDKLPLVKKAMKELVDRLGENDSVAIVVYASSTGLVLPSTHADQKSKIHRAIDRLAAGGSTNGGEGIQLAYKIASENFIEGGTNRVILCTDGDFNIGISDQDELVELIQQQAKSNVFLSVIGCGTGNYKDAKMEQIADKGNGNYAYIDTIAEARKVLIQQMSGTFVTIAKDVKIQVEFNPATVAAYRLIGYENRKLNKQDFDDDTKDAGEIGAGHTVTALYELVPAGVANPAGADRSAEDESRYVKTVKLPSEDHANELLTLKLRYKQPDEDESSKIEFVMHDTVEPFDRVSNEFQFASAVAAFGMILRDSQYSGNASLDLVKEIAQSSRGEDKDGYRSEFLELVQQADRLMNRSLTRAR